MKKKVEEKEEIKFQIFNIYAEIYGITIKVIIAQDRQFVIDELNLHFRYPSATEPQYIMKDFPECVNGMFFQEDGYDSVLWIPNAPQTPLEHATLAHEALHAVAAITRFVCLKWGGKSEEAFCYLLGYLLQQIYEKINLADSQ